MLRVTQNPLARNDDIPFHRLACIARILHPVFPEPVKGAGEVVGVSRQSLHRDLCKVVEVLSPRRPGPKPGARRRQSLETQLAQANALVAELTAENARLTRKRSRATLSEREAA